MTATDAPRMKLVVVIPAHNEATHIRSVIEGLPEWVHGIIVVDDGSTDDTAAVVASIEDPRVTLLRHERNRGVGAAMKTGYAAALESDGELVAKMDADGQMLGSELLRLVTPFSLGMADYTKGNRFYFPGAEAAGMPRHRSFGNTVFSFLTKLASGYWHVYDSQCGFTVVSAYFLRLMNLDELPDDYFFENAMLIKLNTLNARVVDVPISTVYGQEISDVNVARVAFNFPPRLAQGGIRRFWRKHLVTDFGPIGALTSTGLLMLLFGVVFGGVHWRLSVVTGRPATTGTVMIAVLPLILGVQLLLQAFVLSVMASPGASETAQYVRRLIQERDML